MPAINHDNLPWALVNYITLDVLSYHDNESGAKLGALFHVENGDKVYWYDSRVSVQVAGSYGCVDGVRRFKTQCVRG